MEIIVAVLIKAISCYEICQDTRRLAAWTQYFVHSAVLVKKRNVTVFMEYNEWSSAWYLSCKCVFTECRCVLCLHHDSVRQSRVSSDEFTARTEELGLSGVNRSSGVAALDSLFGFQYCSVCHISSAKVFKRIELFMLSGSLVLI